MSARCALILAALCTNGETLEQARSFVRQGLLREAEGLLRPLAESSEPTDRARALLLLGNVDYERGLYDQALERYDRAANDSSADDSTVAAARSNRVLAEERVRRAQILSGLEHRLSASLAATLVVAACAIAWMARRARGPSPER